MANPYPYELRNEGKGICPHCGKRTFSYYYDTYTNQRLPECFGKCDRKIKCGYERSPYKDGGTELKEYKKIREYNEYFNKPYDTPIKPSKAVKELVYLDEKQLDEFSYNQGNSFIKFLESLIGDSGEVYRLCKRMNVKTFDNEVIFLYQDLSERFTRGKIMKYDSTGHRIKKDDKDDKDDKDVDSLHNRLGLPKTGRPELHLFGLHLLNLPEYKFKPVALVESEKTAILGNYFYPENVWMATGSLENLNRKRLNPLKDKKIILYPDKDAYSKWLDKAKKQNLYRDFDIEINDCFENRYYSNGFDMADYIAFKYPLEEPQINFDKILLSDDMLNSFGNLPEGFEIKCTRNIERIENYYSRFYYNLGSLNKEERNKITIDNEEIIEIDATALHPRILGKLHNEHTGFPIPEFLKGDSHSKIAELLGVSRDKAKIVNLSYWNSAMDSKNLKTYASKDNKELFRKMDNFLKAYFAELFNWLIEIKYEMKPINGTKTHSNMSIMMIDREVRIMNELINRLFERGIKCLYVYDAVYVKASSKETVEKLFNEILEKHLTENKKSLLIAS